MNRQELLNFISENNNELLLNFYDKTYIKLADLNKRIDKLTGYLLLVVFLYLVMSKASFESFQIGPVIISDMTIPVKLLPILFAYLLCDIVVTSGHKSEVFTTVKFISLALYKQKLIPKELENDRNGLMIRMLLPFSYSMELLKFNRENTGCVPVFLGIIVSIPLLSLMILPFYFEYYMLRDIFQNHYNDLFGKISFYFTIWIVLMTIYYVITNAVINIKDQRTETF